MSIKEAGVEGANELIQKLENMSNLDNLSAALGKACALVERAAKEKAPSSTGELRRSITSKVEEDGAGSLQGVVYTPLEYAPYVEYGTGLFAEKKGRQDVPWSYQDAKGEWHQTSGMSPRPYMRPALDENREEILKIIKEGTKLNG